MVQILVLVNLVGPIRTFVTCQKRMKIFGIGLGWVGHDSTPRYSKKRPRELDAWTMVAQWRRKIRVAHHLLPAVLPRRR
jgi:hypothetical protein